MARDYIRLDTGTDPGQAGVEIIPEMGSGLEAETQAAREAVTVAGKAQREAAARSRTVARKLSDAGLTGRDISAVLRVSPQRVSQLLGGHRIKAASAKAAAEAHRRIHR
jgi:uncharacterized protein YggE